MPGPNVPRSQDPVLPCSYSREPCILVAEQGNDLFEGSTSYEEHVPCAPPPSPIKYTPLTCTELNEACPSTSCALRLVDRKIKAHQATLSPIQRTKPLGSYPPTLMSDSVSRMKLECPEEQLHRMTPLRQVSSASDDDDMTVTSSDCPSSRSSGTNTLVNDLSSDKEVDSHSEAIPVHTIAKPPQSATQPSSPKSPASSFFNLRSSRAAIAGTPSRFRSPSRSNDASGPQPTVTGWQFSPPTPIGSSVIPDVAALPPPPPEYTHSKTRSWPGPCSHLAGPDIVSMPKATRRPRSRKCDFACACCGERKVRYGGGMPSCGKCLSRSEICSFNKYTIGLQPLKEQGRREEATDEQPPAITEEAHSHFSDDSSDEDDDGENLPSNVRLFNSLGRLNQRSRTRLSWNSLFSKS